MSLRSWFKWRLSQLREGGRLMRKQTHEKYVSEAAQAKTKLEKDLERSNAYLNTARYTEGTLRKEIEAIKATMDRVVPRLVNLSLQTDPTRVGSAYRLILDMSPFLIRDAFEFGNDDTAIRCLAERVGHMFYRELKTSNLQRFSEPMYNHPNNGYQVPRTW